MVPNIISTAVVAASLLFGAPATQNGPGSDPDMNIVETAISAGSFNTLVAAVKAAGLVETLSGPGPFTVFAPTDEAFAQIPADQLNALLPGGIHSETGQQVLTYHVVAGKVMAEDVVKLSSATTVNGQDVDIKVWDGKVMIDDAQVTTADIDTTNGVIHVINKVILPEM